MNMDKKTTAVIGVLILAIVFVGWRLLAKGGLFATEIPEPVNIETAVSASPVINNGAVLGANETPNYSNPLNDIYVNPFEK